MPKNLGDVHKEFRDIINGRLGDEIKVRLKSGNIFRSARTHKITIPQALMPSFNFVGPTTGFEVLDQYGIPEKKKKYRSLEDAWEPAW